MKIPVSAFIKEADPACGSASRMMSVREIVSLKYGIIPYGMVLITGHPAEISAMQQWLPAVDSVKP